MSEELDEDGLTALEREYLSTSFAQLSQEDRRLAMTIRDKRDNNRWTKNTAERQAEAEARKATNLS